MNIAFVCFKLHWHSFISVILFHPFPENLCHQQFICITVVDKTYIYLYFLLPVIWKFGGYWHHVQKKLDYQNKNCRPNY